MFGNTKQVIQDYDTVFDNSIPFRKNDLLRITYFTIPGVQYSVSVPGLHFVPWHRGNGFPWPDGIFFLCGWAQMPPDRPQGAGRKADATETVEEKQSATMVRPRADHECACALTIWLTCMTVRAGPCVATCMLTHSCTLGTDCAYAERWGGKQCAPGLENPVPRSRAQRVAPPFRGHGQRSVEAPRCVFKC